MAEITDLVFTAPLNIPTLSVIIHDSIMSCLLSLSESAPSLATTMSLSLSFSLSILSPSLFYLSLK